MRLDLCLQLRIFERQALEVCGQMEHWQTEFGQVELPADGDQAQALLNNHDDSVAAMQAFVFDVLQQGLDLAQRLDESGLDLSKEEGKLLSK